MAANFSTQEGQDFCRILVLTAEKTDTGATNAQCGSQTCMDAALNCQKTAEFERETLDIEKGAFSFPKPDHETTRSIKVTIPSMAKLLRRQNSSLKGGESVSHLMNQILMLLKFVPKEKQGIERAHDASNNRWRKYKRVVSFDSRQIVMLFSILSSMGTIVLIFLTLRVRLNQ